MCFKCNGTVWIKLTLKFQLDEHIYILYYTYIIWPRTGLQILNLNDLKFLLSYKVYWSWLQSSSNRLVCPPAPWPCSLQNKMPINSLCLHCFSNHSCLGLGLGFFLFSLAASIRLRLYYWQVVFTLTSN